MARLAITPIAEISDFRKGVSAKKTMILGRRDRIAESDQNDFRIGGSPDDAYFVVIENRRRQSMIHPAARGFEPRRI
ncbi:hypothetical protein [Methylosinus sp. PW1]|uniref:hypothetical protein n=1 Tax=Methylosinus sp. PW1 TaxID=107636 RepID=UPI0018DD4F3F|nr:hypothetical protein [Methylosinus sp. PW1]